MQGRWCLRVDGALNAEFTCRRSPSFQRRLVRLIRPEERVAPAPARHRPALLPLAQETGTKGDGCYQSPK